MATNITPADLPKNVYKFGSYVGPDKPSSDHEEGDENKLFKPVSFRLEVAHDERLHAEDDPVYKLHFRPVDDTNNIIYFPCYPKYDTDITPTIIPINNASVCYFFTDVLWGCDFNINEQPNGNLVCYHTNASEHRDAQAYNEVNLKTLRERDYYAKAQALVDRKVKKHDRTEVKFIGGTTIIGLRVAERWEFWFQTYGRLTYGRNTGVARFLKGKEVKAGEKPLKIVDAQRFWRKEG